ncbi:MAG: hydrogenase large subunit [Solirubrobacteraceae bacterium]|nr:hydrogenase large subunit [Solirubrobacteraceae bacterium]
MAYAPTGVQGQQIEFDPVSRVAGALALHATIDAGGRVSDATTMAGTFRGYELLLKDRDVRDAIFISSRACGVCGGAHAICSALALEMMFGVRPPQYGITIRNVLAAVDNLADHPCHLFLRAGPDYSEPVVRDTNPELWTRAQAAPAAGAAIHGFRHVADIMTELTRFTGSLYREALYVSRIAREAYVLMGGKYPHPQTIVPGGVSSTVDPTDLNLGLLRVNKFLDYSRRVVAVWDDLVDFLYAADPRYGEVGAAPANFVDLGMWDDPEYYDGTYETSASWGERRWSTPGAIVGGQLQTTNLQAIDSGIEEFVDRSFYEDWVGNGAPLLPIDPLGNPLSARHPWNKQTLPQPANPDPRGKYTWSTAPRWQGHAMEAGAYARLWITAMANKLPHRGFLDPTGHSLRFGMPQAGMPEGELEWHVPDRWNALERNRARAYALVHSTLVAYENMLIAFDLARIGGAEAAIFAHYKIPNDHVIGVGYWGGGRGYISHHVEADSRVIRNYQIVAPTSFMAARDNTGAPGPLEQAVIATPSLSSQGRERHVDLLRAIRSFDPCMSCSTH